MGAWIRPPFSILLEAAAPLVVAGLAGGVQPAPAAGPMGVAGAPAPCSSSIQFRCRTAAMECIAVYNQCDGIPQCSDGSDELNCTGQGEWHCGLCRALPGFALGALTSALESNYSSSDSSSPWRLWPARERRGVLVGLREVRLQPSDDRHRCRSKWQGWRQWQGTSF